MLVEARKQENLHADIARLREEIVLFWEKCLYSTAEKEAFKPFYAGKCIFCFKIVVFTIQNGNHCGTFMLTLASTRNLDYFPQIM